MEKRVSTKAGLGLEAPTFNNPDISDQDKAQYLIDLINNDPHLTKDVAGVSEIKSQIIFAINSFYNNPLNGRTPSDYRRLYGNLFDKIIRHPDYDWKDSSGGLSLSLDTRNKLDAFFGHE